MSRLSFKERILIPTYNDPDQLSTGEVAFDYEKCTGCTICIEACPADTLVMNNDKRPEMKPKGENECIFCGDCMAICPEGAISMKKPYTCTLFFKTVEHGEAKPPRLDY